MLFIFADVNYAVKSHLITKIIPKYYVNLLRYTENKYAKLILFLLVLNERS